MQKPSLCSLRPLVVLLCGLALILALGIAGNELVCRQTAYGASLTLSAPPQHVVDSARSVEDFCRLLTPEEVLGWRHMPRYTKTGYQLTSLPPQLREQLQVYHRGSRAVRERGNAPLAGVVRVANLAGDRPELERGLEAFVRGELERWSGAAPLEFSNSYGPRTYGRGSTLAPHGDRIRTHALSAIVFVGSPNLRQHWPLQFVAVGAEAQSKVLEVYLSDTSDVLLYESTQPHGRETPLDGESYSALFMHWSPPGWRALASQLLDAQ